MKIKNRLEKGVLSLATFLLLTGCGSGDISTLTSTGQLVDSNISGVDYNTSSGRTGTTNANGYFTYLPTDTNISFSIGGLKLPVFTLSNINSDGRILPTDFTGVDRNNTTDANVTKLLRLFQSLDDDGNASNGITITDTIKNSLTTSSNILDMNITALGTIITSEANKTFISESAARNHYESTLGDLNISYTEVNSTAATVATSGKLVDPYISGAVLCQDTNDNNVCDSDEPVSSITSSDGNFTFSERLTAGKNIIIKTQGLHEGEAFDLNISGVVASDGSIDVVSPLTTFQSRGLTATQIAAIFTKAKEDAIANDGATKLANFSASSTSILANPLDGGLMDKNVSGVTDADLTNIQASIASYGLLKIMNGSTTLAALNGTELYTSGTTTGSPVNLIARGILKSVSDGLNVTLLTDIKTGIVAGRTALTTAGLDSATAVAALPEPPIGMVVKVAVKILDQLAELGYTTCNTTSGDDATKVTAVLTAVGTRAATIIDATKIKKLGTTIYGLTYKNDITSNLSGAYLTGLASANSDLGSGFNSSSSTVSFKFDSSGNVISVDN
jgi:hypothetical protein